MSAYMLFNISNIKELRDKDPEMKVTECTKDTAAKWNVMTDAKKAKWNALNQKDVQR
jgi:hypothetical protein